jgi:3-hydroxyacyl-CoA dehydrogenase
MRAPEAITTLGVVGTGAIGASWVALGIARGLTVVAWDPADDAEERLRRHLAVLGTEPDLAAASMDGLRVAHTLEEVGAAADVVLESGPERLDVKRDLFSRLDAVSDADVLLCSSSSGLMPSSFQDACARHPERVVVAHPFNPPHLVPLVEVVGGARTSEDAMDAAIAVLRHLGKTPIRIRREMPGHVANRLQAALWREAYHLVEQGVVSVSDIDTAISTGPGLRWALLGPFATQHLSGGPGGFAHVMAHLGPPMVEWWRDLGEPELTPALVDLLVAGVDDELAGTDADDLVARRDRALADLMTLKGRHGLA